LCEDVRDGGGEEEETFGELEGDALGVAGMDSVDGFGDFKIVVRGEERDGGLEVWVVYEGGRDLVEGSRGPPGGC
jgi:hypothetical protein